MRSRQAASRQPKRPAPEYDPVVHISPEKRTYALRALYLHACKVLEQEPGKFSEEDAAQTLEEAGLRVEGIFSTRIRVWFIGERVTLRSFDDMYGRNAGRTALKAAKVI